jgi:signal recognition particle GTPase
MEPELLDVLREAVKTRQRKEELERAVGRTLRRRDLDFKIYVQIMSELRETADTDKISTEEAAAKILAEKK